MKQVSLPDLTQGRVLILGDLMLDRYWMGSSQRISPEAPVPVVNVEQCEDRPGGAANVANNCAALGSQTALIGVVGDDEPAQSLRQTLQRAGVTLYWHVDPRVATITKLRILSQHQQLLRTDFEQPIDVDAAVMYQSLHARLPECDLVVFSDYGKGTLADCQRLIQACRQAGRPCLVDPKGQDFERYRGATLLTPNQTEFEAVVGRCRDAQDLADKAQNLLQALQWQALLVTQGAQGMTLIQPNQMPQRFLAKAQEVYDVTGAGDTVIATLASALACGAALGQATDWANTAASLSVQKLGTATVSAAQLRSALAHGSGVITQAVVEVTELIEQVRRVQAQGKQVVFTNGCFDLLHAGHVTYLQQAAQLGDCLIVALNSDASVARLKGDKRPINPLAARMAVMASLASVTWVCAFEQDTPEQLIELVQPNILVKGGDYTVEQIVGARSVLAQGGQVHSLAWVESCSTSQTIATIIQRYQTG